MTKHGSSHGLAVITCCLSSGLLVKMGYDAYPKVVSKLEYLATQLAVTVQLDMSGRTLATLLLASGLATIWGMAFSVLHSDH